jgi:hypothetical protein
MGMARGKGNKKDINPFDGITIVDNPAPAGRVNLLSERYDKELDLWTGQPLMDEIIEEEPKSILAPAALEQDDFEIDDTEDY